MKIVYFNDNKSKLIIRISLPESQVLEVAPLSKTEFEVKVPEGATLFVKQWDDVIMFSHVKE